ncbi:MAG: DNA repair protein RecO [Planctomycetota bacterium]
MPPEHEQAICLRAWDWSETSQTVAFFTPAHGIVRALAKGSRRERTPYSGGLEPMTLGETVIYHKRTHDLATLASWALIDPMQHARRSLEAYNACLLICEILQRCFLPADPHPRVFDAAWSSLQRIGGARVERGSAGVPAATLGLVWAVVDDLGHRPELERSASDGAPLEDAPVYGFSPESGGLLPDPGRSDVAGIWRVRGETVQLLQALASDNASPVSAEEAPARRALALLLGFLSYRTDVVFAAADRAADLPNRQNRAPGV